MRKALRGNAEPEPGEYLDALYRQQKTQAELDALFGSDVAVAPEMFDAFEQEAREGQKRLDAQREDQEEVKAVQAQEEVDETQADNPEMSREEAVKATNEKKNRNRQEQIETAADAEYDPDFEGGVCQSVEDPQGGSMCKLGFLAIGKLKVLPNFKIGADAQTGVVEPLKGDYRADHDPIRVWRRADGSLMVISGRHRLEAAKRAGMDKISAFVYEEGEVHDGQWARRYDIESNIRDNQATALETALYVRGEWNGGRALSDEEIARAGIARKGKAGSIGCEIARKGSQAVMEAWRNGALTEQQAFWIASFMPGKERAQRAGVCMAVSGDVSKGEILTAMEAAEAIGKMGDSLGVGQEVDLFGNALDNDSFLNFVAKYITRKRNEIGKDLAYIGATATKRNAAEMAKKYGVDIKNPEAMKRKQEELQRLKQRWSNPYTDSELMDEIRAAYRKETLEGRAEGGEAKGGAVEGQEAPEKLPGEAEGQGVLFSREPVSLRIWNARLHDLHKVQGVVAGERAELDMSAYGEVETLGKVQERWNRTLDDYSAGKLDGWRRPLTFGQTPAVLRMLGAPALRMTITRDVLDKVTKGKHNVDIDELRKLPDSMHEPLAVFRSGTQLDSMVVLTELHEEGKPVIVAVHINREQVNIKVNKIASVYGKLGIMSLFQGVVLYADMTKIGKWTAIEGLQLPKIVESISRGDRVLNPGAVVKWKNENNLPQVHFSVIGENAMNWDDLSKTGLVFTGADGKKRVEIDASKARVVYPASLRRSIIDELSAWMKTDKAKVLKEALDDKASSKDKAVADKVERDYRDYIIEGVAKTGVKLSKKDLEKLAPYVGLASRSGNWDEVIDIIAKGDGEIGRLLTRHFATLGEVLDFPELYKAYPDLRDMPVGLNDRMAGTKGMFASDKVGNGSIYVSEKHPDEESVRSTLLHEVQHAIQRIEGFEKGSNPGKAGESAYMVSPGEVEARTVQLRRNMSEERRVSEPFDETYARELELANAGYRRYDDVSFSVTIPADRVCRTRAEARRMVGRKGEPLHLENRFLELEAVFNSKSDGKFNDRDSIGRSIAMLTEDGLSEDEAMTAHYTAYGNIAELFANGDRMEFERAYKKKDVRKGFLHVYSPFDIEGRAGDYEANIELEIHQMPGQKPTAYLLNVYIQKRKSAIESGDAHNEPLSHAVPTSSVADIEANFPGIVKRGGEKKGSEANFSIFGMTARGAACADERGETYVDPADGKRKWVVSDAESRLRDNFTFGQLNVTAGGHKDTTLGAVLHFPALFENYPDLDRARVRFYKPQKSDGLGGYFNPYPADGSAAYIAVNIGACRTPGKVLETLRHESQHWIQSAEGHAMGGGFSTVQEAARYLENAIEQRKVRGVDDAWSRDNLAFLQALLERVKTGDGNAVTDTYMYSRGEQEARFTGGGAMERMVRSRSWAVCPGRSRVITRWR